MPSDNLPQLNIDFLNELDRIRLEGQAQSIFKQLLQRGILPLKVSGYREIYMQVTSRMTVNGGKKHRAMKEVASLIDVDFETVKRAMRFMKRTNSLSVK